MNNTNLLKTGFVNERFRYYEKLVAELTMMSDMFMRNVLNILECAEYVLRVITENDDLELTEVVVQKDYKNLQGRSAVLDCVAVNGRKEIYDIEVQQEKAGAGPKRLRYHSSIIDTHSLFAGEDFEKRLQELIMIFDLQEFIDRPVGKLSGGQRRRVDIARALIHRPQLLILDEPTTGLDPQTRKMIWNIIEMLREEEGLTVLLTTHYMEEAASASYVVMIDHGCIAAEGTPYELKNHYVKDYLFIYGVTKEEVESLGMQYEEIRVLVQDLYRKY